MDEISTSLSMETLFNSFSSLNELSLLLAIIADLKVIINENARFSWNFTIFEELDSYELIFSFANIK